MPRVTPTSQSSKPKKTTPKLTLPDNFLPAMDQVAKTLPSKGLAYGVKPDIKYRGYVVGEIKEISQHKNMSVKTKILKILEGIECNFDKMDLTLNDLIYLSFMRQMNTLGTDKMEFEYKCPSCRKISTASISMSKDIEFKDLEAPKLPVKVKIRDIECEFMPLTVGRYLELFEDESKINEDDFGFDSAAKQITNLDFEVVKKLFYSANLTEAKIIGRVSEYLDHSLQPLKYKCVNLKNKDDASSICGHTSEITLQGGEGFMLPFRELEESVDEHIHFG